MIHDFDMAAFLMGDMPVEVMAKGSVLTDSAIGDLGDFDSANAILTWKDGRQVSISNSRRASYGYDQRIEVHGSKVLSRPRTSVRSASRLPAPRATRPPVARLFHDTICRSLCERDQCFHRRIDREGQRHSIRTGWPERLARCRGGIGIDKNWKKCTYWVIDTLID